MATNMSPLRGFLLPQVIAAAWSLNSSSKAVKLIIIPILKNNLLTSFAHFSPCVLCGYIILCGAEGLPQRAQRLAQRTQRPLPQSLFLSNVSHRAICITEDVASSQNATSLAETLLRIEINQLLINRSVVKIPAPE